MKELRINIPEGLEIGKVEERVQELIMIEVKRRLLVDFTDEVMKGGKQLSEEKLIKLGRKFKNGRFEYLKKKGLVK